MAEVTFKKNLIILKLIIFFFISPVQALEIIRDEELEQLTRILSAQLLDESGINEEELKFYFINNAEINAFVTGGTNIFINTGLITSADDYREYQSVLAHELAHIIGGHIFNTKTEIGNLSSRAMPVYLLGVIGILTGAAESGVASILLGQASVQDGFTYYSRNQEASADQAAANLMCKNKVNAKYLTKFLNKLDRYYYTKLESDTNYRSTHPSNKDRKLWIESALKNKDCDYEKNIEFQIKFDLLKAKLFAYTHKVSETRAIYTENTLQGKYALAIIAYLSGEHKTAKKYLGQLIRIDPENPFFWELYGEIHFINNELNEAVDYQSKALDFLEDPTDLYYMIIGNYLISINEKDAKKEGIKFLKKSILINPKNTYSWYLLARAYADIDNLPFANYATAERYYLIGERKLAYEFAKKSLDSMEKKTPEWYRANDLMSIIGSPKTNETNTD